MEEDEDGPEEEDHDDLLLELPTGGGAKAPGNWSMAAVAATNPKPAGGRRQPLPARHNPGQAGKWLVCLQAVQGEHTSCTSGQGCMG